MTDLPSPEEILEELAERVAVQIDRSAITSFDLALGELTRYHLFLLGLSSGVTDDGQSFSYAEVAGNDWSPPHRTWMRQYRRLLDRAADRIPEDDHFFTELAATPDRLMTRYDEFALSREVAVSMADFGPMAIHRLEAWLTKQRHRTAGDDRSLAGSDFTAYENVVTEVIASWESLLQLAPSAYRFPEGSGIDAVSASDRWKTYGAAWPFYFQHLKNTAYFVAVAVWNDDDAGASLLTDALLRWHQVMGYHFSSRDYFPEGRQLYPDLFKSAWDDARAQVNSIVAFDDGSINPETLFAELAEGAYDDVVFLTIQVLISWMIRGKPKPLSAKTARSMIKPEFSEDSDRRRPFRDGGFQAWMSDVLRLEALGYGHAQETYSGDLDHFVATLDQMTERRVVPGRVYTPSTLNRREQLVTARVVIWGSTIGGNDLKRVVTAASAIAARASTLPDGDVSLRSLLRELERYSQLTEEALASARSAIQKLEPDRDADEALRLVVDASLSAAEAISASRSARLENLPIDSNHIEQLRGTIEGKLLASPAAISFFRDVPVSGVARLDDRLRRVSKTGGLSKGQFVSPQMEQAFHGLDEDIARRAIDWFNAQAWNDFTKRERRVINLEVSFETAEFWQEAGALVATIGPEPVLIISREAESAALRSFLLRSPPPSLKVERKSPAAQGRGGSYIATVNSIDVFGAGFPKGVAWLFSRRDLVGVNLGLVDTGRYVKLTYIPEGAKNGALAVEFWMETMWSHQPALEIRLPNFDGGESSSKR